MFKIKVLSHFSAAHQLSMMSEKCENLHGHNWKVEVCVKKKELNEFGVILDFSLLKDLLKSIMKKLDHTFLNDLADFSDRNPPSSENIAVYVSKEMQRKLKSYKIMVDKVTVWESENACATYLPNK